MDEQRIITLEGVIDLTRDSKRAIKGCVLMGWLRSWIPHESRGVAGESDLLKKEMVLDS